jgi:hypothetical protein
MKAGREHRVYTLRCRTRKVTQARFAAEVNRVVQLRYARSIPVSGPSYSTYKSPRALEQDLRRELKDPDEELISEMIHALFRWRFTHIDPMWGFGISGGSQMMFEPKRPRLLIKWIDEALIASGDLDQVRAIFVPLSRPQVPTKNSHK